MTTPPPARTFIVTIDDDLGVSRAVARDLRRRYGDRYLSGRSAQRTGCVEREAESGWWVHLRRCAQCGHRVLRFLTATARQCARLGGPAPDRHQLRARRGLVLGLRARRLLRGPRLPDPQHHPVDQTVPGPAGRVPADWRTQVH